LFCSPNEALLPDFKLAVRPGENFFYIKLNNVIFDNTMTKVGAVSVNFELDTSIRKVPPKFTII